MKKRVLLCLMCVLGTLALYSCGVDPSSVSESTVSESSEESVVDVDSIEYIRSVLDEVRDEFKYKRTVEIDGKTVVSLGYDTDLKAVKKLLSDKGIDVEKIKFEVEEPRVLT